MFFAFQDNRRQSGFCSQAGSQCPGRTAADNGQVINYFFLVIVTYTARAYFVLLIFFIFYYLAIVPF